MKKVIGGVTYNTDTARMVAPGTNMPGEYLYTTPKGRYFLVINGKHHNYITSLTDTEAMAWMAMETTPWHYESMFGEPAPKNADAIARELLQYARKKAVCVVPQHQA